MEPIYKPTPPTPPILRHLATALAYGIIVVLAIVIGIVLAIMVAVVWHVFLDVIR